jgi:hypothetical protein
LTIPKTLNFGLANGLQVRDTSQTGYIQRRLIKGMEDIKVEYDMTVRNNKNRIVQFSYGEDGIDTVKIEHSNMNFIGMTPDELYAHFYVPVSGDSETRPQNKMDSINEARTILNRCWFSQTKCELGISRLREYRKKYNDKLGCFMDQPLHDINSNGADAFQTFGSASHQLETFRQENDNYQDEYVLEEFMNASNRNAITGY